MNKKQREIIVDAYEHYIRSGMQGDPVGGYTDLSDLFQDLKATNQKLSDEMEERYNEIPESL